MRELERCVEVLMEGRLLGGGGGGLRLEAVIKFFKTVFRGKVAEAKGELQLRRLQLICLHGGLALEQPLVCLFRSRTP